MCWISAVRLQLASMYDGMNDACVRSVALMLHAYDDSVRQPDSSLCMVPVHEAHARGSCPLFRAVLSGGLIAYKKAMSWCPEPIACVYRPTAADPFPELDDAQIARIRKAAKVLDPEVRIGT